MVVTLGFPDPHFLAAVQMHCLSRLVALIVCSVCRQSMLFAHISFGASGLAVLCIHATLAGLISCVFQDWVSLLVSAFSLSLPSVSLIVSFRICRYAWLLLPLSGLVQYYALHGVHEAVT